MRAAAASAARALRSAGESSVTSGATVEESVAAGVGVFVSGGSAVLSVEVSVGGCSEDESAGGELIGSETSGVVESRGIVEGAAPQAEGDEDFTAGEDSCGGVLPRSLFRFGDGSG